MEKMMVYQSETDSEIEMEIIGRLRYVGNSIFLELTDGKVYPCVGLDRYDYFRIVIDEGEDYLMFVNNPRALQSAGVTPEELIGGKWEVVEDPTGQLQKALDAYN